jgi:hypothetical protein
MSAEVAPPERRWRWVIIALIFLGTVINYFDRLALVQRGNGRAVQSRCPPYRNVDAAHPASGGVGGATGVSARGSA